MGQQDYVPEATPFTDFPLFEDPRPFWNSTLPLSWGKKKNLCFSQQFCGCDWRNTLESRVQPKHLYPSCHFSINSQLFSDPEAASNTLLPNFEHLITAHCKSPKASQCLNFYCVLFLITTCAFVRSCRKLKIVCQA